MKTPKEVEIEVTAWIAEQIERAGGVAPKRLIVLVDAAPELPEPQQAEPWAPGVGKHSIRGGGDAVVYTTEGSNELYPLVGEYRLFDQDAWRPGNWSRSGSWANGMNALPDLVAPKESEPFVSEPLLEGWVNKYDQSPCNTYFYTTESAANAYARPGRLRCVRVREVVEPAEQGGAGL